MEMLITWLVATVAILGTAAILPGAALSGFGSALIAALVLGAVNAFIKPLILLLTLPVNILTLGLFTLVINALMIMLVAALVPGFSVDGFWAALLFSIVLTIIMTLLGLLFPS